MEQRPHKKFEDPEESCEEIVAREMKKWLAERYEKGIDRAYPINPLGVKARISSGFGYRNAPEGTANHEAIDLVPADDDFRTNVPVIAAIAGRVLYAGKPNEGSGYSVIIGGDNGKIYSYAHLKRGDFMPEIGARVERGERIGTMGNTGNVTKLADGTKLPCLHFVERSLLMEGKESPQGADRSNYDKWLWKNSNEGAFRRISGATFQKMIGALGDAPNNLEDFEKWPPRIFYNVDPRKAEFLRANEPKDINPQPVKPPKNLTPNPSGDDEKGWGGWIVDAVTAFFSPAPPPRSKYNITIPLDPAKPGKPLAVPAR